MSRKRKVTLLVTALLLVALLIVEIIEGPEKKSDEIKVFKTENLVIDIPDPCSVGSISVAIDGEKKQLYYGTINIANDGKDGEQIDIILGVE